MACPYTVLITTIGKDSEKFHQKNPLRILTKKFHNTDNRHSILGETALESFLTITLLQHLRTSFESPFEEFRVAIPLIRTHFATFVLYPHG